MLQGFASDGRSITTVPPHVLKRVLFAEDLPGLTSPAWSNLHILDLKLETGALQGVALVFPPLLQRLPGLPLHFVDRPPTAAFVESAVEAASGLAQLESMMLAGLNNLAAPLASCSA